MLLISDCIAMALFSPYPLHDIHSWARMHVSMQRAGPAGAKNCPTGAVPLGFYHESKLLQHPILLQIHPPAAQRGEVHMLDWSNLTSTVGHKLMYMYIIS